MEDGGKIIYVGGTLPEMYNGIPTVDLGNRALIPAFVDTHQHFASFSTFFAGLNVMDAASNAEIAQMFGINEFTVREHVTNIMTKLDASNRAEAVATALRKSLLKF